MRRLLDWLPVEIEILVRKGTMLCTSCDTIQLTSECHVDGCKSDACTASIYTRKCVLCRDAKIHTCEVHRDGLGSSGPGSDFPTGRCKTCCTKPRCPECEFATDPCDLVDCSLCPTVLCILCAEQCEACMSHVCNACRQECDACGFEFLYGDCIDRCSNCDKVICTSCSTTCDRCYESACS